MPDTETPIVVTDTVLPAIIATALRYVIVAAAPVAIAKGWVDAENVDGIVTAALAVATVIYAMYVTRKRKRDLIAVGKSAPDKVAVVVDRAGVPVDS